MVCAYFYEYKFKYSRNYKKLYIFFPALLSSSKINVIFHEGSIEKFYENYRPIVKKLFKKIINNAEKIILLDRQQKISLEKFIKPTKLFVLVYRMILSIAKLLKKIK